ncbi:MAG: FecR domain-containing protein, partial [Elusimicrobiota bacterium]
MGHLSRRVLLALLLGAAGGFVLAAPAVCADPASAAEPETSAVEAEAAAPPVITSEAVKSKRKVRRKPVAKPTAPAPVAEVPEPDAQPAVEPPAEEPKKKPRARKAAKKAVPVPELAAPEPAPAPAAALAAPAAAKKAAPEEPDESALVSGVEGFVEKRSAGRKDWAEAEPGGELKAGDRLQTYAEAGAKVEFHEGSKVELSPFSILSIEKAKFDHIAVGLYQGKVTAQVSWRARRKFEVRAPGAAVVAKADEKFSVSATSDRRVRVEVEKGEVSVFAVGAKKKLKARETVEVVSGRMGPVELLGPAFTPP